MPRQVRSAGSVARGTLIVLGVFALCFVGVRVLQLSVAHGTESPPAAAEASPESVFLLETGPEGTRERELPSDGLVVQGTESEGTTRRVVTELISDEPEPVIVELRARPLLRRGSIRRLGGMRRGASVVARARQELASEHVRAGSEIVRIVERRRARSLQRSRLIRQEYSKVFNGFAASLSPEEQQEILDLPDVLAIHPDREFRVNLDVSVPLIDAPEFWSAYGYRGEGMVIAVVDTGVDYTHPDLGGCLGPGCKVVGGYDVYNNDPDPIDDHGHGTHCAATAAGDNPSLMGVAPEARILAYKVLSGSGSGSSSHVVAGIERAVDPDGDGDTSDRADVISMSLGGPDEEGDPAIQAVENATATGALAVVAAGNAGAFFKVQTPGAAPSALTVGATNDYDQLASFSSKGPALRSLLIKPEITAPGVSICAARAGETNFGGSCFDGAHGTASGTSMATPHVAGVAALVRGLSPGLSPAEVKSLLVNNSTDIGLDVMEGGAGRVDVPAAAAAHTTIDPALLSFGQADLSQPTWSVNRPLTVRNRDDAPHSYSVSTSPLPQGLNLTVVPSSFALDGGQSLVIDVELVVDNTTLPDVGGYPYVHEGTVLLESESQVQRVPFAFLKQPPSLLLEFDVLPIAVMVHDRDSYSRFISSPWYAVQLEVPGGVYDVVALFPVSSGSAIRPRWVVRQGIEVSGDTTATISRSEADHQITHVLRDAEGEPIGATNKIITATHEPTGFALSFYAAESATLGSVGFGCNDVGADYSFGVALRAASGDDDYFLLDEIRGGVGSDVSVDNHAANMSHLVSRFHPRPGEGSIRIGGTLWRRSGTTATGISFSRQSSGVRRSLYLTPVPRKPFPFRVEAFVSDGSSSSLRLATSHALEPDSGQGPVDHLARPFLDDIVYRNTGGRLPMNLGPFFWHLATDNSSESIAIRDPVPSVDSPIAFLSQGPGIPEAEPGEPGTVPWALYSQGVLLDSGVLSQTRTPEDSRRTSDQPPGIYQLRSTSSLYPVSSTTGVTQVEFDFDTRVPSSGSYDPDPPYVKLLEIRREGIPTNKLRPGAPAIVTVEASDQGLSHDSTGIDVLTVTYSTASGNATVPAVHVGPERYEAEIDCDPGLGNLSIFVTDQAGNSSRQDFQPAFQCRYEECGDGVVDFGEECDDGNMVPCDGCSATCRVDGVCGNGIVESACEECDDGNTNSCDGCSATCGTEGFCGDGLLDLSCEQCDDGDLEDGDCCSSICLIEPQFTVCRRPAGPCDVLEFCTGSSGICPADTWRPAGTVCRPAMYPCDQVEFCDGSSSVCPGDTGSPDGVPCDDGLFCNGVDRCSAGTCSVHEGDPCEAGPECRNCNEATDLCFDPVGSPCSEDSNVCTDDVCDGQGACTHPNNNAPCHDPCSENATCESGSCVPGTIPVICTPLDQCHLPGTCNPVSGGCTSPPKPDGSACDDGDLCTEGDVCTSGMCGGGAMPDSDGDAVCDQLELCADQVDADGDGIGDLCDNCPAAFNPDQRDSDGSDGGDVCDLCPLDGEDRCIAAQSTGRTVDASGGTLTVADGSARIEIPPGALTAPTSLSITEGLSEVGGTSSRLLFRSEFGPTGLGLGAPATAVLRWSDGDDDGWVDGLEPSLAESDLRVWRNGVEMAGPCGDTAFRHPACTVACCDPTANTWTLRVDSLGQYVVGEPVGMLIPGSQGQEKDCIVEFEVVDPHEDPPTSSAGVPVSVRTCVDGDPACDVDGERNGSCAFALRACLNVDDSRYLRPDGRPLCAPSDVAALYLKKPRLADRKPWRSNAAEFILELLSALGPSTVTGASPPRVSYTPAVEGERCTPGGVVRLFLEGGGQTTLWISLRAVTGTPAGYAGRVNGDTDRLILKCREGG